MLTIELPIGGTKKKRIRLVAKPVDEDGNPSTLAGPLTALVDSGAATVEVTPENDILIRPDAGAAFGDTARIRIGESDPSVDLVDFCDVTFVHGKAVGLGLAAAVEDDV